MPTAEAKKKITAWLEEKGLGKKTINYKLRDWLFSRQRYWGEPFPIIWKKDAAGNLYHEALPESALPLLPPSLEDYKPTADGQPPLARAKDWLNLPDGSARETNTMPQWAGSCWYYLRYLDAKKSGAFVGKEVENYWMGLGGTACPQSQTSGTAARYPSQGVDLYVGGTEHAVLHLLYARFWHKVLFDLGYVSTPEPFFKLVNQGIILGEDGQKMSKSRGNVVNPDDVLAEYGADAFRLYEMFMGPLQMVKPWSTKGVEGVYRFLGRVWRLFVDEKSETEFEQAETNRKGAKTRRTAGADQTQCRHQRRGGDAGAVEDAARLHQESHGRPGRDALQHGDFRDDGFCQRRDHLGNEAGFRAARFLDFAPALRAASGGRALGKIEHSTFEHPTFEHPIIWLTPTGRSLIRRCSSRAKLKFRCR